METERPFLTTPPHPSVEAIIVIPVRDEAARLNFTLDALAAQVDLAGWPVNQSRWETILLANNCTDESAAMARAWAAQHPAVTLHVVERVLPPELAHVGWARRLLMDEAEHRLTGLGRERGVIASTDGDTRAAPTWFATTLAEVQRGADAVGGRILADRGIDDDPSPAPGRRYHLHDTAYQLLAAAWEDAIDPDPADPWPRHHQLFGASLAVTAAAYLLAGRLPPEPALEDMAFGRALRRVDARVRHSPLVQVATSARPVGRAAVGLATQLAEWDAMAHAGAPALVESAAALTTRVRARRELRTCWWSARAGRGIPPAVIDELAAVLAIENGWLAAALAHAGVTGAPFGTLLERVETRQVAEGRWVSTWPPVDVVRAIADLRAALGDRRRSAISSGGVSAYSRALEEVQPVPLLPPSRQVAQFGDD